MNEDWDNWIARQERSSRAWKWTVGAGLVLLIVGVLAAPVLAHSWYPRSCCSDKDCWKSAPDNVTATQGGWRIESSGEIVPYDDPRVHPTPPEGGGTFHTCHLAGDPNLRILCLFVPEFGS